MHMGLECIAASPGPRLGLLHTMMIQIITNNYKGIAVADTDKQGIGVGVIGRSAETCFIKTSSSISSIFPLKFVFITVSFLMHKARQMADSTLYCAQLYCVSTMLWKQQ